MFIPGRGMLPRESFKKQNGLISAHNREMGVYFRPTFVFDFPFGAILTLVG